MNIQLQNIRQIQQIMQFICKLLSPASAWRRGGAMCISGDILECIFRRLSLPSLSHFLENERQIFRSAQFLSIPNYLRCKSMSGDTFTTSFVGVTKMFHPLLLFMVFFEITFLMKLINMIAFTNIKSHIKLSITDINWALLIKNIENLEPIIVHRLIQVQDT